MKKIGVVGCGVVADYGHLPTIKQIRGLELTALYDPNETNLKSAQEKFSVPHAFTNIDEFYETDIDAVVITSPAPCHKENVIDAARHGKHILCEKPLGMTSEEIQEMIKVTEDANVMLFTAFDYRFSHVSQIIKQLVREKAVGEVKSLRLIYIWNMHGKYTIIDGQKVVPQRRIGRMNEGGPMVDCGVHQIDLARWWLESEVVRWCGEGAWVDEYEAPDHVYVHMDHENGAHTMVEISYSYCFTAAEPISHFTYQLIGTDGLIRFDRELQILEVRNSKGTEQFPPASEKNFHGMYVEFAKALETGYSDTLPTAYDGLIATNIARTATEEIINRKKLKK